ncbi:hypothetical protein ABKN59_009840 [Abortiporus biennis]
MDSYLSYDSRQRHIESQMHLANTEPEFWEVIQERWSGLHLEANSNMLYDFGLSQNIEQLHVPDCSLKHVTSVHRIVQDLEPKVLRIELTNLNKLFTEHLAYTSGIFQYERLTSLSLSLVLYALEVNETENIAETEAEHAIDTMIEILRTTSLKYLHLDLRWFHPNTSEWLPLVPSNRSLSDAELDEDYLQHLPQSTPDYIRQLLEPKQDNMMEKIIGAIPSLEYLSVVLRNKYPCTWKSTKSWKIVTIDGAGMRRVKRASDPLLLNSRYCHHLPSVNRFHLSILPNMDNPFQQASTSRHDSQISDSPKVLNLDVLCVVLASLEQRVDILSFMKTCKALYQAGIPHLLRRPFVLIDIVAYGKARMRKYKKLLKYFQEYPSRLQYVEDISEATVIWNDPQTPNYPLEVFKMMIENCSNLKKLSIPKIETHGRRPGDETPLQFFLPAKLSLSHLRHIEVFEICLDSHKMLRSLEAPVVSLSISFNVDFHLDLAIHDQNYLHSVAGRARDPLPLLTNFVSTLEELALCRAEWDNNQSINNVLGGIRYPRVHTLKTRDDFIPNISLLMYTFPNVKTLELYNSEVLDVVETRNRNVASQEQLSRLGQRKGEKLLWSSLEYVKGDVQSLYGLGLQTFNIHRLQLFDLTPNDTQHAREIIESTKPVTLKLGFREPRQTFNDNLDDFKRMLLYDGLKHLSVSFDIYRTEGGLGGLGMFAFQELGIPEPEIYTVTEESVAEILDEFINIVSAASSLTYLHLSVGLERLGADLTTATSWDPSATYSRFEYDPDLTIPTSWDLSSPYPPPLVKSSEKDFDFPYDLETIGAVADPVLEYLQTNQTRIMERLSNSMPSLQNLLTDFGYRGDGSIDYCGDRKLQGRQIHPCETVNSDRSFEKLTWKQSITLFKEHIGWDYYNPDYW